MLERIRITTEDNPYNPFTEWDDWFMFDLSHGYHTCERLASITSISDQLSDDENNDLIESGIDELMRFGCIAKDGSIVNYKKVYKEQN